MPKNGQNWPTVNDMVAKNQRLVVFTSKSSKEASEGFAYQWRYVVENQYGDGGMKAGVCTNRAESPVLSAKSISLVLQNFFPDNPSEATACKDNSGVLSNMLSVCYGAAGKRWANFLAVDFYKRSDGGGAFQAVDKLNGELICGCSDVQYCQPNATFGVCRQLLVHSHTGVQPSASPTDQETGGDSRATVSAAAVLIGINSPNKLILQLIALIFIL
eukprot:Gb_00060 [translate_table: standard]